MFTFLVSHVNISGKTRCVIPRSEEICYFWHWHERYHRHVSKLLHHKFNRANQHIKANPNRITSAVILCLIFLSITFLYNKIAHSVVYLLGYKVDLKPNFHLGVTSQNPLRCWCSVLGARSLTKKKGGYLLWIPSVPEPVPLVLWIFTTDVYLRFCDTVVHLLPYNNKYSKYYVVLELWYCTVHSVYCNFIQQNAKYHKKCYVLFCMALQ